MCCILFQYNIVYISSSFIQIELKKRKKRNLHHLLLHTNLSPNFFLYPICISKYYTLFIFGERKKEEQWRREEIKCKSKTRVK
uniref:Putative ovule protein n=1 Tax=Solanum chacoense TaxID=4108 RepID=A0A0V0I2I5_SOLCH